MLTWRKKIWSITVFAFFAFCVALIVFVVKPDPSKTPSESIALHAFEYLAGEYDNPGEIPQESWKPISLSNDNPPVLEHRSVWLRIEVSGTAVTDQPQSLYIPTVRQNVRAFLNETWIGQGGSTSPYSARLWQHPQIFKFPPDLLDNGSVMLYLNVISQQKNHAFLSPVYIGPLVDLMPVWKWRNFLKIQSLQAITYLLFMIGGINLAIWFLRRHESFYGWYALAAFAWGLRGLLFLNPEVPMSERTWVALRSVTLGYGVVFIAIFNQRFFGWKHKIFDRAMIIYCVPACIPFLFLELEQLNFYAHEIWARIQIYLGLGVMIHLIWIFIRQNQIKALLLVASGVPLFVFGLRDFLVLTERWDPSNGFLINYATLPALILAMWFILQRFTQSLTEVESLNIGLRQQVDAKEREILDQYKKQEEMQKTEVLNNERQRIMRDLHDGVAGHLIGLKSYVEREKISPTIVRDYVDRSLSDLRFVINSMDIGSQSISSILGMLRRRWQSTAEENDIILNWQVAIDSKENSLGIRRSLHIHRILEEAFSNSIRHSHATSITVSSETTILDNGETVHRVILKDNGTGSLEKRKGHGLRNMDYRANRAGAELKTTNKSRGFEVRIEVKAQMPTERGTSD